MSWAFTAAFHLIAGFNSCGSCPCLILPGEDLNRPATMVPRARRDAAAIFTGRVIAVDTTSLNRIWLPSDTSPNRRLLQRADTVRYTFEVNEVWKGKRQRQTVITAPYAHSSCGRSFDLWQRYLVYAERGGIASSCARVKLLTEADADLKILGKGEKPRRS